MKSCHQMNGPFTLAAAALVLGLAAAATVDASSIPKPDAARSWMLVSGSDCDDDGPNANVDRGHCIGAVNLLDTPGDIGHDIHPNYQVLGTGSIGPELFRGRVQSTPNNLYVFMDMSMIDTYTLASATLPAGTVVPVTVTFRAVGTLHPENFFQSYYGGGGFSIRIGNSFNMSPIVIPENTRVQGPFGPTAEASYFISLSPSGAPIPLDLTATASFNATIGTPFDLAYYLGARPAAATIDFSNTATISFTLPEGTIITSTGGYGQTTPVVRDSWSRLKTRFN